MKNLKDLKGVTELTTKDLKKINGGWINQNDVLTKLYGRPTAILNGRIVFYG